MFVGVVLNPRARKNRGAGSGKAERLARLLGPHGEVVQTESLDDLPAAVERLLSRSTHLVSDGGDGALHCLINEVRDRLGDEDSHEWPTFVPTNGGTIDFIARRAEVRGHSLSIVEHLASAASRGQPPLDVCLDTLAIDGERVDGSPFRKLGFAVAAGGIGNRFFDKYYEDDTPSPATIVRIIVRTIGEFALGSVGAIQHTPYSDHLFRPTSARVTIDGTEVPTRAHDGLHAGSFDVNFANLLRLFPEARDLGTLHFQAGAIRPIDAIKNLPRLIAGRPVLGDELLDVGGTEMCIEAEEEVLRPIIDGERYVDIQRMTLSVGPPVRIARIRA